jgi:hypothetical protein
MRREVKIGGLLTGEGKGRTQIAYFNIIKKGGRK